MSPSKRFRIVSYNLHDERVEERHPSVVRCIEQLSPDILCTQEGSPDQLLNLHRSLSHPDWVYVGEPFDEWNTANAIFFRSDLFELVRTDTFWLNENPREMSRGWGAPSLRACTWVELRDKRSGKRLFLYNVHLDFVCAEARFRSILLLFESIQQEVLERSQLSLSDVLFAGDFNCWPEEVEGSTPMEILVPLGKNAPEILLMKEAGFIDTCFSLPSENFPTLNNYLAEPLGPKIDFIWCQDEGSFRVNAGGVSLYQENGQFSSDHCPVYADLEWDED